MPPLFTYAGDNFEKDFDIGLLSEYLFDGSGPAQLNKQQSNSDSDQIYSNNDFINFANDDQLNFDDDDDDDNDFDDDDFDGG